MVHARPASQPVERCWTWTVLTRAAYTDSKHNTISNGESSARRRLAGLEETSEPSDVSNVMPFLRNHYRTCYLAHHTGLGCDTRHAHRSKVSARPLWCGPGRLMTCSARCVWWGGSNGCTCSSTGYARQSARNETGEDFVNGRPPGS
jgi:hypothetical protein